MEILFLFQNVLLFCAPILLSSCLDYSRSHTRFHRFLKLGLHIIVSVVSAYFGLEFLGGLSYYVLFSVFSLFSLGYLIHPQISINYYITNYSKRLFSVHHGPGIVLMIFNSDDKLRDRDFLSPF